jgi:hypothetical protein
MGALPKPFGSGQVADSAGSGQGLIYPNNGRTEQEVIGKRRTAGSFCEGTCIFQMAPDATGTLFALQPLKRYESRGIGTKLG